jgi:hypothetical protein
VIRERATSAAVHSDADNRFANAANGVWLDDRASSSWPPFFAEISGCIAEP